MRSDDLLASVDRLVSAEPGSQLSVFAEAGGHDAELVVLVVRHHGSGWVREIARKDEDSHIEAEFEPETGVVTVYEGRREFKALERAARRAGQARSRVREYVPYRMLEVEVAANAVYWWAAERISSAIWVMRIQVWASSEVWRLMGSGERRATSFTMSTCTPCRFSTDASS